MPSFGKASTTRLKTIDARLQCVLLDVIKDFDFTIVCGYRNMEDQNKAYREGKSQLKYPNSKHNTNPSKAVDIAPWRGGIQWNDREAFYYLAGLMIATGKKHGLELRWGGDFNQDNNFHNDGFLDLPHFELVE